MGTFPSDQQGGLITMNLHDLITLIILLIGTSGTTEIQYMKYTSEYIPKLQIHQQDMCKALVSVTNLNNNNK